MLNQSKTPSPVMKTILLTLTASSLLLFSTSCRTFVPIDPNTGEPSCRMMPDKKPSCNCPPCACTCQSKVKPSK